MELGADQALAPQSWPGHGVRCVCLDATYFVRACGASAFLSFAFASFLVLIVWLCAWGLMLPGNYEHEMRVIRGKKNQDDEIFYTSPLDASLPKNQYRSQKSVPLAIYVTLKKSIQGRDRF